MVPLCRSSRKRLPGTDAERRVGGMEGHVSRDCSMEAKAKSCYKCGEEGHIVRIFECDRR
jgi:hypothetical protein